MRGLTVCTGMGEPSSLRQAGGSGCVDQHGDIIRSRLLSETPGQGSIGNLRQVDRGSKIMLLGSTIRIDGVPHLKDLIKHVADGDWQFCIHNQDRGSCGAKRVGEGFAGEVGVDEGTSCSDFVDSEPAKEELGLVLHEERDDLSSLDTL